MYIKYMALMPICGLFWTPCSLHEEYLMNFSPLAVLLHASNIYYTFPLAAVRIFVFRNYLNICDIHVLHPFVVKFWSITSEMMLQNFTINGWSKLLLMWHSLQISKWNYLKYIRKGVWNACERRKKDIVTDFLLL